MSEPSAGKVYRDSRAMAWFAAVSLVALMAVALFRLGADAVPIVTAGLPTLGVLVGGYVGVDRGWGLGRGP